MAARDVKLYLSLKKAILDKVAQPDLPFHTLDVDGSPRSYDYDYIFQIARRVFPQKYHLGHSYLNIGTTSHTNIAEANKEQLNQLNMEFAKDLVAGWGGTDQTQIKEKELDSTLIEYENELTAPDEPDYLYQELNQNALPEEERQQEE